jgi:hypothetical protein
MEDKQTGHDANTPRYVVTLTNVLSMGCFGMTTDELEQDCYDAGKIAGDLRRCFEETNW